MTFTPPPHDAAPPAFLQLAGHPLRWALLRELSRSDRMVQELTGSVAEPQNLVSYHLGKLRKGGLVSSRRSSADGRDTYYAVDLTRFGRLLSATGAALHPGLKLSAGAASGKTAQGARVLFLCSGNSARSQMAEALLRARSGGAVEAFSAGSAPKTLHPNAIRVMREVYGLDISAQQSKHLDLYADQPFDRVISLCDKVRENCPAIETPTGSIHWSLANPATGEAADVTYPLFLHTAAELETRIRFLLADLAGSSTTETRGGDEGGNE